MMIALVLVVAVLAGPAAARECRPEDVHFEMMTGYVYSAPGEIMATSPGVLRLGECVEQCRHNASCHAVNFETGLCVLFAGSYADQPGALTKSQFPVFTIFAQKTCIRASCSRPWVFEVVRGNELRTYIRRRRRVGTRRECMELCLQEHEFTCRSANFNHETGDCAMSDMDRFTVSGLNSLSPEEHIDYIESNCVSDPLKMCDFTQLAGRILKTVDSIYQDVSSVDQCRQLCLQSTEFRCHTFDFGDTGPGVCRLSHHAAPSLQHIEEPYLELEAATTHQLTACYNVTVDCRASDMVARIRTNKVFNGKVYAKNRPNSCVADVVNDLEFDLRLGYHDLNCDVKQDALGRFSTDIIIQHHDQIVTSQDVGLSVRCSYNLQNRSVGHGMELQVSGDPDGSEENAFVLSPTVTMRITDRQGHDIHTAQVGDALSLRFNILDEDTPYQIFVRELVALDGVDSSEILLIDSLGCPTDPTIMGPITSVDDVARSLQAPFDAFKFPTSDVVQFKALVTPCLPSCEPVSCDVEDYYGIERRVDSYGKRKRREVGSKKDEDMLLVQSIRIADKFQFSKEDEANRAGLTEKGGEQPFCMNILGLAAAATIFLCTQVLLVMVCLWQRKWRSESTPPYHIYRRGF
ncbi:uncharacterized protein [Periplaneta americana]|uniref:uncharacterized protein n=1 Tax=Periplaneta americana TaxID=6978 RepID=UPI0037E81DCA